jgi:putative chitinase
LPLAAVDRKRFFDRLRREQGTLRQGQVRALEFLLSEMEADPDLTDTRHASYMLATVAWETARTFEPIDERGGDAYFNKRYGPQTRVGKRLGNMVAGDGARYHGRGYVQLTGRANYERAGRQLDADLVGRPELAKDPGAAYRIMSEGMRAGWFTGKKLTDYIAGAKVDYRNARRIINGLDRADEIAELARDFEAALRAGYEPPAVVVLAEVPPPVETLAVEAVAPEPPAPVAVAKVTSGSRSWALSISTVITVLFGAISGYVRDALNLPPELQKWAVVGITVLGVTWLVTKALAERQIRDIASDTTRLNVK